MEDKHLEDTHKVKQVKKVEDKHLEETNKVKHFKKVEHKGTEEVHKMQVSLEKQPRRFEVKPSEDIKKTHTTQENPQVLTRSMSTHENPPILTRSMSASALIESPSALSRKVSSMSRRVKETLEKVMAGTLSCPSSHHFNDATSVDHAEYMACPTNLQCLACQAYEGR